MVRNLNVKNETIQVLENNIDELLFKLSIRKVFLTITQNPKEIKD